MARRRARCRRFAACASLCAALACEASLPPGARAFASRPARASRAARPEARRIRAVLTDVDGTLCPFGTQTELSPANRRALRRALREGMHVGLATGRIPGPWSDALEAQLPGLGAGVFCNGAVVVGPGGEVLSEAALPEAAVRIVEGYFRRGLAGGGGRASLLAASRLPERAREYGGLAYTELAPKLEPTWVTALIDRAGEPPVVMREDLADLPGRGVYKFVVFTDAADDSWAPMAPVVEDLREALAHTGVTVLDCGPKQCEILPAGVNKGTGVAWLLEHLGVAPSAALACGDAENDVEMLRLVGVGAAMGNGKPQALEAADVVVADSDKDGVAEALLRFAFGGAEEELKLAATSAK